MEQSVPKVVFSRCLGFDHCRYNGEMITDRVVEQIKPHVEAITVCPEMAVGLGVPRHSVRLVEEKGVVCLFQPESGQDVTEAMAAYSERFLTEIGDVDGFILKYRSPSCGPSQVRVYNSRSPQAGHRTGRGAFAHRVLERFGDLAVEDEGRLQNYDVRQHFLTRLFTLARFRRLSTSKQIKDLVDFHSRHKLLLMAYNQTAMRDMGRIVANQDRLAMPQVLAAYREALFRALARAPRSSSAINVLQHGFGYVSDRLSSSERSFFAETLDQYRTHQLCLSVPTSLLRSWIVRFEIEYLLDQLYFEPFPHELVTVLDSGKGRSVG